MAGLRRFLPRAGPVASGAIDPQAAARDGIPNRAAERLAQQPEALAHIEAGVLSMGRYSFYAPNLRRFPGDRHRVRIGSFCSVAADADFYVGGQPRTDWVTAYPLRANLDLPGAHQDGSPASRGDIEVGHDAYIALQAAVLSGVRIGTGAVVATRAVVTRDVAPYAVVAGNPAREVRRRFSDERIAALLRIAWWEWPVETIVERVAELNGGDVDEFIAAHDPGA